MTNDLNKKIDNHDRLLAKLSTLLEMQIEQQKEMKKVLDGLERSFIKVEISLAEMNNLHNKINSLEVQTAKHELKIDKAHTRIDELNVSIEEFRQEVENWKVEFDRMCKSLEATVGKVERLGAVLDKYGSKLLYIIIVLILIGLADVLSNVDGKAIKNILRFMF